MAFKILIISNTSIREQLDRRLKILIISNISIREQLDRCESMYVFIQRSIQPVGPLKALYTLPPGRPAKGAFEPELS